MKEESFQSLLSLFEVGIQPVTQICATHKRPQQRNMAIMGCIATPCEQGIDTRSQRGDKQQTTKTAMGKSHKESYENRYRCSHDDNTTPLLKKATSRQW